MLRKIPHDVNDFKQLVKNGYFVDKTHFIKSVLTSSFYFSVLQYPPSCHSILSSMMECFFKKGEDNRQLFEDLEIGQDAEAMTKCGEFPTIRLDFKNLSHRADSFDEVLVNFKKAVNDIASFYGVTEAVNAENEDILEDRIKQIHRIQKKRCILIIDAPDYLLQQAVTHAYSDKAETFLAGLFGLINGNNHFIEFAYVFTNHYPINVFKDGNVDRPRLFNNFNNSRFDSYFKFSIQEVRNYLEKIGLNKSDIATIEDVFENDYYIVPKQLTWALMKMLGKSVPYFDHLQMKLAQRLLSKSKFTHEIIKANLSTKCGMDDVTVFEAHFRAAGSRAVNFSMQSFLNGYLKLSGYDAHSVTFSLPRLLCPILTQALSIPQRDLCLIEPNQEYANSLKIPAAVKKFEGGVIAYERGIKDKVRFGGDLSFEYALQCFNNISDPRLLPFALNNKAATLFQLGKDARSVFAKALALSPRSPVVNFNLGVCYLDLDQLYIARFYFNTAKECIKDYPTANFLEVIGEQVDICMKEIDDKLMNVSPPVSEGIFNMSGSSQLAQKTLIFSRRMANS